MKTQSEYFVAVGGGMEFPTKSGAVDMAEDLSRHTKDSFFFVYREFDSFLVSAHTIPESRSIAKFVNGRRV